MYQEQTKKKKLWVKKAVAVELADAVADANARGVIHKQMKLLPKWEVVVVDVDVSRANPVVALESTPADTAGELLFTYSNI
jgi:hypothetical protein